MTMTNETSVKRVHRDTLSHQKTKRILWSRIVRKISEHFNEFQKFLLMCECHPCVWVSKWNDVIMTQLLRCVGWDSSLWCLAGGASCEILLHCFFSLSIERYFQIFSWSNFEVTTCNRCQIIQWIFAVVTLGEDSWNFWIFRLKSLDFFTFPHADYRAQMKVKQELDRKSFTSGSKMYAVRIEDKKQPRKRKKGEGGRGRFLSDFLREFWKNVKNVWSF